MKIFYFTSTGNCLAVAKRISRELLPDSQEAELISIAQLNTCEKLEFEDEAIGVVFPIYGFGMPEMVSQFLQKARWKAKYSFVIGTYGNLPGSAVYNAQKLATEKGNRFDYAASLLMVDNYLPNYDIADQIAKLPKKQTEENLSRIISELRARKKQEAASSLLWKAASFIIKSLEKSFASPKQAQSYLVNGHCNNCGICARVCPSGNIEVCDKVVFGDNCKLCLGCIHNCPQNALHIKTEKSSARWRNPEVSLKEIIAANEQRIKRD